MQPACLRSEGVIRWGRHQPGGCQWLRPPPYIQPPSSAGAVAQGSHLKMGRPSKNWDCGILLWQAEKKGFSVQGRGGRITDESLSCPVTIFCKIWVGSEIGPEKVVWKGTNWPSVVERWVVAEKRRDLSSPSPTAAAVCPCLLQPGFTFQFSEEFVCHRSLRAIWLPFLRSVLRRVLPPTPPLCCPSSKYFHTQSAIAVSVDIALGQDDWYWWSDIFGKYLWSYR